MVGDDYYCTLQQMSAKVCCINRMEGKGAEDTATAGHYRAAVQSRIMLPCMQGIGICYESATCKADL